MFEIYSFDKKKGQVTKENFKSSKNKMSWIRIINLDAQKIELLSKSTGIELAELKESLEEEERPKVSSGKYLEIIYRAPSVIDNELETVPLYFYLFNDKLVTIEKKPLIVLDIISESLAQNQKKFLFKKGLPYFVHYIIDKINDDFLIRIDKISSRIDLYENFSKREMNVEDIEKLYDQSVILSFFNQALIANLEVLNQLKKNYFKQIPRHESKHFEELYYDLLQILDTEKIQREVISNLINVHSVLTSTRLNEFMKRLTIIALVITIPTILSGLFGMNFIHIPLRDHPLGFYVTSLGIIIVTFFIYWFFNKKNKF
jgi:magnesium transporter